MIVYRTGDVVEAFKNGEIDVLVHGVNAQGKMNSGIAKQIRAEFPQVFKDYEFYVSTERSCANCENCCVCGRANQDSKLLGDIQSVRIGDKFQFIVNAFTQDYYGYDGKQFCSYDAINKAMRTLNKEAVGNVVIGMPKIGAGLGGGDWKVIEAIINSHFKDREIFVYSLEETKSSGQNDSDY